MDFQALLKFAVDHNASDIHIQADLPPTLRIGGLLRQATLPPVKDEELRAFIASIAPAWMHDKIDERLGAGLDFSYALPNVTRFRCSAYRELGRAGMAMRIIRNKIPSIAELHLPQIVHDIALSGRGLILVTGTTGSGKSTTLAAMIDLINSTHASKIITIEDPVEYLHKPKHSLIAQLEVGSDTPSFDQALRQGLRQDPDVVLVGELRDMDTLRIALRAADTGHQVFSTVHSASAPQTIERIIAMFPPSEHKLLLTQLAGNLTAIISQRLVICTDGSRRPAVEILRGGPVPTKYILEGRALELADYMKSAGNGMQTFDQDLFQLNRQQFITAPEALRHATNPEALTMQLRGISSGKSPGERQNQGVVKPPARPPVGAGDGQRHG
jgi:twitching motility protein PilT